MQKIVIILVLILLSITSSLILKEQAYGETYTDPVTAMEFVKIKNGLYMGKFEVTNAQFRKYRPDHNSREFKGNSLNGDTQPAVYVSANDADDFAKWLSDKTGMKYRLPTNKDWESACKAGTDKDKYWVTEDDACLYANVEDKSAQGDSSSSAQFKCDDGFAVTAPAGSKMPNNLGLYDMLGNVWEWSGDISNDTLFIHGGSWDFHGIVSCTFRNSRKTGMYDAAIGFRLVLEK
ncbi:MAG: formylglycine-generating enzyme family protein [Nitrospirae bacterium YQR-1]